MSNDARIDKEQPDSACNLSIKVEAGDRRNAGKVSGEIARIHGSITFRGIKRLLLSFIQSACYSIGPNASALKAVKSTPEDSQIPDNGKADIMSCPVTWIICFQVRDFERV